MINATFTDLQRVYVRDLWGEMCPESSHDAYETIRIKVEVPSDTEAEEDTLAITFPEKKAEPEVNCVSVSLTSLNRTQGHSAAGTIR
jgi:hypothetical protein